MPSRAEPASLPIPMPAPMAARPAPMPAEREPRLRVSSAMIRSLEWIERLVILMDGLSDEQAGQKSEDVGLKEGHQNLDEIDEQREGHQRHGGQVGLEHDDQSEQREDERMTGGHVREKTQGQGH